MAKNNLLKTLKRFKKRVQGNQLTIALAIALTASIGLTITSVIVYNVGDFYRFDLSRPGYEKERTEISRMPADVTYDTTSPVTVKAAQDFAAELQKSLDHLSQYSSFDDGGLSDQDLEIVLRQ